MKKIGILCFWGVPNYGAWTQAYALNNIVRQIMGNQVTVEHIDYLTEVHYNSYYENNERLHNAFHYSYECIPHTSKMTADELEKEFFDVVITGSDSIWEYSVPEMGYDRLLIGNGIQTEKLIAYAPSIGVSTEFYESWIKEGLEKYKYLSARDVKTQEYIYKITGNFAQMVLDPSLVWDLKNDKQIISPTFKNYIVVYGSQWDLEFIEAAQKFAKEKSCKLISIGYINDWCDISFKMIELRALEWLGMFKGADYVITSTFHGLMVGISFEKSVFFDQVEYVKNRSESLLKQLGIVYYGSGISMDVLFENRINYEKISVILQKMRQDSRNYLERALLGEENDSIAKG